MEEKNFNITVTSVSGEPVEVHVHHFHHYVDSSKKKNKDVGVASNKRSASNTSSDSTSTAVPQRPAVNPSSEALLKDGAVIRLCVDPSGVARDGSCGCYLGWDGANLVSNMEQGAKGTLFTVKSRVKKPQTDDANLVSLVNSQAKYLRITATGAVDCSGGGGRWTMLTALQAGTGVAFLSVANSGKMNKAGSENFYLSVEGDRAIGNGAMFVFAYETVSEAEPKCAHKSKQRLTPEEKEERKNERAKKKALAEDWVKVGGDTKVEKHAHKKHVHHKHKKNNDNNNEDDATPKVAPAAATGSPAKSKGFPVDTAVVVQPAHFLQTQNRKGGTAWHLGVSPMGFLCPDAGLGWGTWHCQSVKGSEAIILESSHTPAFHLAINKEMMLTHKGGKGKFAQFLPVPHGRFWLLKSVGFESDVFLACSPSGLLYASTQPNKDARFLVSASSTE